MELITWELVILPNAVALAAVAVLGYIFGRRKPATSQADPNQMRQEMTRAKPVVDELERIAQEVRRNLATHHSSILKFRDRLNELGVKSPATGTDDICREAEELLQPTVELAASMTSAYEALRRQMSMIMSFTELRTDALTKLSNRRTLDESITSLLAIERRYHNPFALAIFDIDHFHRVNDELGREGGDAVLQQVARLLETCVRETDIVARFGGAEFVVVMPETDLEGASVVARRVCRVIQRDSEVTVSSGLAQALDGDSHTSLLKRADKALNAAKSAGRNCIFQHYGLDVEAVASTQLISPELDVIIDTVEHQSVRPSDSRQANAMLRS